MKPIDLLSFSPQFPDISSKITIDFGSKMKLDSTPDGANTIADLDEENDDQEDEEFSFVCLNPNGSPISAEDAFDNGQIRTVYPIFNRELLLGESEKASSVRPPLRKIFVEASSSSAALEGVPEGTYCEWSAAAEGASPELGKKSNSTGFSKLWRFRELVHRSSSDGKDAFVFLSKNDKAETEKRSSGGKVKGKETVSSAHERHYVRNRAKKEEDKRRSYLPYRPGLVGFFTNVNGLSRNVHPF